MQKNAFSGRWLREHHRYVTKTLLVMKLTIILLTAAIVQVSAKGLSQTVSFNGKNIPIQEVFSVIKKQTGFSVAYNSRLLDKANPVSLNVTDMPLRDFLNELFTNQPLNYSIKNTTIVIARKSGVSNGRTNTEGVDVILPPAPIRGRVLDADGKPLAGASVSVKNSKVSGVTDAEGAFSINVSEGDVIRVSYVGYLGLSFKVQLKGGAMTAFVVSSDQQSSSSETGDGSSFLVNTSGTGVSVTITLKRNERQLDEVVVNKGYYSTAQKLNTGNVSSVKAADLETQPVTNVLAAMQGRMAGVFITQTTGAPGGGFDIKIRGQNSLRSDANAPLYVIDGVPYSPDNIGSPQTSTPFPYPFISNPLNSINPDFIESIDVLKDADATAIYGSRGANGVVLITTKSGKKGKTTFNVNSSAGWGKVTKFLPLMNTEEYIAMRNQAYTNDGRTSWDPWDYDMNGTWDQTRYTDWQKVLLGGTTKMTDAQASVSGGSENTQFLLSTSYHQETTVYPGDFKYKRGGAHLSLNHSSADHRFKFVFSGGYNIQNNTLPAFDLSFDARFTPPNAPALYKADGTLNWENSTWTNPLAQLNSEHRSKTNDLTVNTVLSYEIVKNLTLKSSFGFTDLSIVESRAVPTTIYNPAFTRPPSTWASIFFNNTGRSSWIIEPQINYEKVMEKSKIDILFGTTVQGQATKTLYQTGNGFTSNSLLYNLAAAQFVSVTNNDKIQYNYQALFGRISYNLLQRYIVNLTGRRDGSSRFGPGKQFANFGAIGAAWIFSEENFIKDNRWLSFGKLRMSYGTTGNDQIGDYQYFNTYNPSGERYGTSIGLQPTRLFNPDFGWEINKKLEFGLELSFAKDRIFTTLSWYRNRSSNQLVGIPLPGTTGFGTLQANLDAAVQNKGLEMTLRTQNVKGTNFKWVTNLNISYSRNKLLSFPGLESSTYKNKYRVGQPLNINLQYQYTGLNQQTGLYEFKDFNNDGNITFAEDAKVITDLNPKFYGGFQNEVSYKKWNLNFLFQFVKQKSLIYLMGPAGGMSNQLNLMSDSWTKPGDKTDHQIATTGYNFDAYVADYYYQSSDGTVTDGSFIRLKNISLSYELPLDRHNRSCKFMLQAQNLLTFTGYKYGDPEYGAVGYLPPLKVWSAGIALTF